MFRYTFAAIALLVMLLGSGCHSADNNYLEAEDFSNYLKRNGLPVGKVRVIPAEPFKANSAVAIEVGNSEIGVYKYDRSSKFQAKRIEKYAKNKRAYIAGIPYPVTVFGSFMFFGLEKNVHKRAILETIQDFR